MNPEPAIILAWNMDQSLNLTREKKQRQKNKIIITMISCPKSDVITIFSIYGQFGIIQKLDSRHIVCKTYIFINSNVLSYRDWKQN